MVADALDGMKRLRWMVLGPAWRPIVAASTMVVLAIALLIGFLLLRPNPIASGPQGVRDDVDASAELSTFTTIGVDTPFDLPLRPRPTRTRGPVAASADRDLAPSGDRPGGRGSSGQGSSGSGARPGPGTSTGGGANPGPVTVAPPTTTADPVVTAPQPDPVKPGTGPTDDQGQGPPVGVPPLDVTPVQVGPGIVADGTTTSIRLGKTAVVVSSEDPGGIVLETSDMSISVGLDGIQIG